MDSTVVSSIHSAMDTIELLENSSSDPSSVLLKARLRDLKYILRKLRTFLLCVRNLGNDVHLRSSETTNLGSLLGRITLVVCRNSQNIHPKDGVPSNVYDKINKFGREIDSFVKEICEWYAMLSDYPWQSSCPTIDEVMDIADSLLENLSDLTNGALMNINYLFGVSRLYPFNVIDPIEALGEKTKFLKNFIHFASLQNVEHQQVEDLLVHSQSVLVKAACLTSSLSGINPRSSDFKKLWELMELKISELLQKIKPLDPLVYQTYIQVLASLKLSRRLLSDTQTGNGDSLIQMNDFIGSLLNDLWEILKDSCPEIFPKDQLEILYKELRFLRSILKEQPNRSDEKLKELLGDVICDAGVIIFSLYQKNVEREFGLTDLLERTKNMLADIDVKYAEITTVGFPRINELIHINFLLEKLMGLTSSNADSTVQNKVKLITEELVFLRIVFREIVELKLNGDQEDHQAVWNCIVEVAYKMEVLIDHLEVGDVPDSYSQLIESIREDIKSIKADTLKISDILRQDINAKKVTRKPSRLQLEKIAPIADEVVGFDAEATSITDRLTRGSRELRVISIVGMPGLGKTTLATKVYNGSAAVFHFHLRAWCHISQVFNKRNVLLDLLKQVFLKELPDRYFDMTEQDLAEDLRRRLKGRTYLIFLDDVWDIQVWKGLGGTLPNDSNGSRILLTSRLCDAVPSALLDQQEPHFLRQLTYEESWELLQKKLHGGCGCPPELDELGKKIAEKCNGLPLLIVIVAGLLANMEQKGWEDVLESLNSGIISSTEQCMKTVELSYKHLPYYLKACLVYFGAFPEGQEVSVKMLIWLWTAEGFIQKAEARSLEEDATDYMMDLVGRSLVMIARTGSLGRVKTCRVHDLLHDFCVTKAKEEEFFQLLKGHDELLAFNEPSHLRRLCIYSKPMHFKESKIYCPRARSLLFFSQRERHDPSWLDISFVIHICKLLKVLDIEQIDLGCVFPTQISFLVRLKYLAIQGTIDFIPSCIGNLVNLETFVLDPRGILPSFPTALWNLQKLRHVCIRSAIAKRPGSFLPSKNLDSTLELCVLESFSGAILLSGAIMEKQLRKLPNIRRLKARIIINGADAENMNNIVVPEFLCRLESLNLSPLRTFPHHIEPEIGFPEKLKKLTLSHLRLPWSKISTIGQLQHLEVLKLLEDSFKGETWEMEEGEFPELRFLKLASLDIVSWTESGDDHLPYLQKLVLEGCRKLKELPYCLENSSTLEMVEVSSCLDSVSTLAQQIQDVQINMGNEDFKLLIHGKS